MASKEKVIASGKQLLLAYVAIRKGDIKGGAKLFVKAAQDENIDPLVDGLAESISNLQAMDEEAAPVDDTDAQLTGLEDLDNDESGAGDVDASGEEDDDNSPAGAETPAGEDTPAEEETTPEEEAAPVQSRAKKFKSKMKASTSKEKKDKGIKMLSSVAKVLDLKKLKYQFQISTRLKNLDILFSNQKVLQLKNTQF